MKKRIKLGAATLLISLLTANTAFAANYQIRSGDTLAKIAQNYGITVSALKSANNLTSDTIYPGNYLYIPQTTVHTVKSGDTLYLIGQSYGVTPQSIKELNSLSSDTLFVGQQLTIPQRTATLASRGHTYSATQSEIDLLARLVYGEARGESLEGQVAVAAVVLNRLHNTQFPNTVSAVVYENLAFTAVNDGQINLTPDTSAYTAVRLALAGHDPSLGSLYYWNPKTATSKWIWSRTVLIKIGNHLFGL